MTMITLSILLLVKTQRSTRALLCWIERQGKHLARFLERREAAKILQALDDHQLKDLGISRWRIEQIVRGDAGSRHRWEINQ
jgi:uncharacterized protein YjiS (DUF1127 family)